jgi:hypothetical protein
LQLVMPASPCWTAREARVPASGKTVEVIASNCCGSALRHFITLCPSGSERSLDFLLGFQPVDDAPDAIDANV